MNKQSNTNGSKRSILEEIDRELAEEARIPRYRLLSPKDSKRLKYLTGQLFIGGFLAEMIGRNNPERNKYVIKGYSNLKKNDSDD